MFITFEGGEGTGKSTQVKLLAERLRAQGKDVITTREPGGTPEAEALRNLLVSGDIGRWSSEAEALLNYAARDSHLRGVIRPALGAGKIVICDRFMDSTRAYQGYAGDCSFSFIDELEKEIVTNTLPNITFVFALHPDIGLFRAKSRGATSEDRYERKGLEFHKKLNRGFLEIQQASPSRCKLIDASLDIDGVASQIWTHLSG